MARLLIIGASGFIGSELARALHDDGHDLRLAARDIATARRLFPWDDWVHADLNHLTQASQWQELLQDIDIVINASGLLQSAPGNNVSRIQRDAIVALGEACSASGSVKLIVQISAAGMAGNDSDFMVSKAQADKALIDSPVPVVVLRPGLVIGRNAYGGTQLIRMAAALPLGLIPDLDRPIRAIALADLVEGVRRAITGQGPPPDQPIDLVGQEAQDLGQIITTHRRWLGLADWRWTIKVPQALLALPMWISDFFGLLGWRSPMRSNAMAALANGVEGDPEATRQWLGREPLKLDQTLASMPSGKQDRFIAWAWVMLPLALLALGIMWFVTGFTTLADLDRATAIMQQTGMPTPYARALALGGGLADIVLAVLLFIRRFTRWALIGMATLASLYLLLGTILLPELWADPLAPLAKVLPMIVLALILLPLLEKR